MTEREKAAWGVAVVATLGMSVSYVDRQTLAAIAPSVTKALAIDNAQYGWLLSAFSMAYLACAPIAGILVDRLGSRRGFTAAILAWSVVAVTHSLAFSFGSLFLLRILLGATESPSFPAAAQAIRRALPGARRPLAVGLLFTGSSIGAILAAKLAIPLDEHYGYRWAFLGTALLGLAWLPAWLLVTKHKGLDRGVAAETLSVRGEAPAVASWRSVAFSPPVLRTIVAVVGSAPALMFVLNWTSKYLVDGWGMPKGAIGNLVVCPAIGFDIGAIAFGALASGTVKTTRVKLIVVAMTLTAALALAPLAPSPGIGILLASAAGLGGGGLFALFTADMLARVPVERAAAAGGMTASAQSLAYVIANPLVGWSIDRTHGYGAAMVALGVVVIPTTIAFIAWPGIRDPA